MTLIRRFASLFACCSLLSVALWTVGCADPAAEDPDAVDDPVEAPAGHDAGMGEYVPPDAGGLEGGSSTGAGVDVPDPLDTEAGEALDEAAGEEVDPIDPEPETP